MDEVNVGVIGTSYMADLLHIPALQSHPKAIVRAICGRNRDRAEEVAKKHEIPLCFTDYSEMIRQGNLDAIVIVTPDDLHYPMAMAALDSHLHVLCEKPVALNSKDAKEMYLRAEDAGVKHMTYFTYRWFPCYRYLKQLVDDGYVGEVHSITIQYWSGYGLSENLTWSFDGNRSNGVLGGLGSHMIDLVHWLIGDISEVGSTLDCFLKRTHPQKERFVPANDTATLSIMLASGAVGTISTSAVSLIADKGQEQIVKIHGKDGTLECKYSGVGSDSAAGKVVTPFEIKGAKFGQQEFKTLAVPDETWGGADRLNMFLGLFTEPYGGRLFIDAILEDRTVSPSLLDGLKAQLVIDAAIESDKTRRWVKVQTIE